MIVVEVIPWLIISSLPGKPAASNRFHNRKVFKQKAVIKIMITTSTAPETSVTTDDMGSTDSDSEPVPDRQVRQVRKGAEANKTNIVSLRLPTKEDGRAIHELIRQCPPLDLNSVYTYLLLCEHFSQTCVVAEVDGHVRGFVSAYIHPERADVLFVWQVAVHDEARGMGLAQRMLHKLLNRTSTRAVRYMETTVGPDNLPSRRMFQAIATHYGARIQESALFEPRLFGPEGHDDERLLRIGPITIKTTEEQNYEI